MNDKQWWNDKHTVQVSGFSDVIVSQKFEHYLPAFDRFRLNILSAAKCQVWEYPLPRWYRSLAARLLILPLLALPFKMELISLTSYWPSVRNVETFMSTMRAAFRAVYLERRMLLRLWLGTFTKRRTEVALL